MTGLGHFRSIGRRNCWESWLIYTITRPTPDWWIRNCGNWLSDHRLLALAFPLPQQHRRSQPGASGRSAQAETASERLKSQEDEA